MVARKSKPVRVYLVYNAARSTGEWVSTLGAARRLANRLYANAATKSPGQIECYLIEVNVRLTRAVAVSLLRGDRAFLRHVGAVDPRPSWWRTSRDG